MISVRARLPVGVLGISYMARVAYVVGVNKIPAAVAAELERLRAENARLLKMLELSPRQAAPPGPTQASIERARDQQIGGALRRRQRRVELHRYFLVR